MRKKFKIKIYKHQKISIFYNFIIPSITKVISFFLTYFDKGNEDNEDSDNKYKYNDNDCNLLKDIYVVHKWLIPIGFFIYILYF